VKLLDHAHLCTVARRLDDNGIRLDQPNHFKSLAQMPGHIAEALGCVSKLCAMHKHWGSWL
jgi:hypothetical protein